MKVSQVITDLAKIKHRELYVNSKVDFIVASQVSLKSDKNDGHWHEELYTVYTVITPPVFLKMMTYLL